MARKILHLTMSILTFIIFVFYTSDITAQMTSISNVANPIASFEDVLQLKDIKVISVTASSWASHMRTSKPGTAKYEVYKNMMENNNEAWFPTIEEAKDAVLSNPNTYLYGYSTAAKSKPGLMALRMFDSSPGTGGIGLQKNSEFVNIVTYRMHKLVEGGILKHIDKKWPDTSHNEVFGMAEPQALEINNVLFPFTVIITGVVTSLALAGLEYMVQLAITKTISNKQTASMHI